MAILTVIVEFVVLAVITILIDRILNNVAAVIVLCLGLIFLGYVHRNYVKTIFVRKAPVAVTVPPPSASPAPSASPPAAPQPKSASKPPRGRGQQFPAPVVNSPDPYVTIPDRTVAMYATEEADRIEKLGGECQQDEAHALERKREGLPIEPGTLGPEGVQLHFWNEYKSDHQETITKLHDSLTFRLGPIITTSQEEAYQSLLSDTASAKSDPKHWAWELCQAVQRYAQALRQLGRMLVNH